MGSGAIIGSLTVELDLDPIDVVWTWILTVPNLGSIGPCAATFST